MIVPVLRVELGGGASVKLAWNQIRLTTLPSYFFTDGDLYKTRRYLQKQIFELLRKYFQIFEAFLEILRAFKNFLKHILAKFGHHDQTFI